VNVYISTLFRLCCFNFDIKGMLADKLQGNGNTTCLLKLLSLETKTRLSLYNEGHLKKYIGHFDVYLSA
ncbi:hypothetical protein, partial [Peribacillus simplex]|uniref:hypothetical protein n=1 Tax=Peribacillus simplex TaxID=1478 RepID=UPI001E4E7382